MIELLWVALVLAAYAVGFFLGKRVSTPNYGKLLEKAIPQQWAISPKAALFTVEFKVDGSLDVVGVKLTPDWVHVEPAHLIREIQRRAELEGYVDPVVRVGGLAFKAK